MVLLSLVARVLAIARCVEWFDLGAVRAGCSDLL